MNSANGVANEPSDHRQRQCSHQSPYKAGETAAKLLAAKVGECLLDRLDEYPRRIWLGKPAQGAGGRGPPAHRNIIAPSRKGMLLDLLDVLAQLLGHLRRFRTERHTLFGVVLARGAKARISLAENLYGAHLPRIVSYNVRHCRGTDGVVAPSRISEVIAGCRADIIALQELDAGRFRSGGIDQAEKIAQDLNMNSYFHPALKVMDELYGDAILTALPSRLVRAGPLPGLRRFPLLESRGVLWTEVQIDDVLVQIINTHLGLLAAERSAQTTTLLGPDWLGHPDCRDPIILAADLNALPSGRNYRRLASMLAANDTTRQLISPATFPSRFPLLRIDHIIASPSVQVQSITAVSTALSRMASDHLPLVADFSLVRSSTIANVGDASARKALQ